MGVCLVLIVRVSSVVVNSVDLVISLVVFVVLDLSCCVCSIVCVWVVLLLGFDACVFPVLVSWGGLWLCFCYWWVIVVVDFIGFVLLAWFECSVKFGCLLLASWFDLCCLTGLCL